MAQGISKRTKSNEIYLIGPVGPRLRRMLKNTRIKIPKMSQLDKDEVHLILEYAENEVFEDLKAPRSNRFIVSHDYLNSRMEMLDEFFQFIDKFTPDLVILSGLHLLENQDETFR